MKGEDPKIEEPGGSTPLISALWRQRQANLCEFEDSLIYKSRTIKQKNPVSKKNQSINHPIKSKR